MTDTETLEKVREIFRGDRFATEMGAVIEELGDHYSKCSLVLNEHHRNAVGGIMGGVYFTLADFAFAVASSISLSISSFKSFKRSASSKRLFGISILIWIPNLSYFFNF